MPYQLCAFAGCGPDRTLTTSVTPDGGGTVSPNGGTYKNGVKITLVATPAKYYNFNGWAGEVSGNTNPLTIKMNSNKSIVASFTKIIYSLNLNVSGSGSGTLDTKSGNYEAGTQVRITAIPATGSRFYKWEGSATGNANPFSILMDTDKTITANFIKQYKFTVLADPTSGTVNPSNGMYDAGSTVELTASPVFPYAVKNWIGVDNSNVNHANVTMTADKSVSVNFVQLKPDTPNPISVSGQLYGPAVTVAKFQMNAGCWIQGKIKGYPQDIAAHIVDSNNNVVEELGRISDNNFTFQAQSSGEYSLIIYKSYSILYDYYDLTYTIYSQQ